MAAESGLEGGWLAAVVLGVVEGITEFLPVSSTGHLIVAASLLGEHSERVKVFEIVIQLGAILAVCWHYRARLWKMLTHVASPHSAGFRLAMHLFVAFLPAAFLGLLLHRLIKEHLFSPLTVAAALIVGGVIILLVEHKPRAPRITKLDDLRWRDALIIGCAQACALFPGVSRSGATIMGSLLWGLSRQTATEFSFLLALPTMFAATTYDLYANSALLNTAFINHILIGLSVSFITALLAIRLLLAFVASHTFKVFGWYRIAFGAIILVYFMQSQGA